MEHDYDLLKPKAGTKGRSCKIKRKSMRRLMAMLLSVVLAAGTCLPAMAAEQPEIQTEEAGVTASTDIEQAAEVQPEEGGDEAVTKESSEGTSTEVTVNDEENVGQAADPVDDNSENAVVTGGSDSNVNAADSDEIASEAITSDTAEIAAEEEPKGAVETDGADSSGASESGNPQNIEVNSPWLNDYDFNVIPEEGTITLYRYNGSDSVITVPGSIMVGDTEYQVKAEKFTWQSGITSITFEGGYPFSGSDRYFFETMTDLEVLDLRNVHCSYDNEQWLDRCYKLKTIYLPDRNYWSTILPGMFKDEEGNHYFCLPVQNPNSIRLDAVTCDEWLEDFSYEIDWNNAIKLTGYHGQKTDLVIPGHAEIDGEQYNEVRIANNIWSPDGVSSGIKSLKLENGVKLGNDTPFGNEIDSIFAGMESLESFDGSELGGFQFSYACDLFEGCINLRTVDLSGFDFSRCSGAPRLFEGCDDLDTIETPVNVTSSVELPAPFSDEDGNIYMELPMNLNESITLTKVDSSEWLKDYRYEVTDDSIILLTFTGQFETIYDQETGDYTVDRRVTVPGSAYIGEKTYKIVLSDSIWWNSYVKELYFEQGVFLPENCSDLFSYDSLEKIDLSGINVTDAADMRTMLTKCRNLKTIVVPKGVSLDSYLPGLFVDENGNNYTSLPKNVSESFTITKIEQDGWLSDYDFYIAGDKIVLTGYHGNESDLVVPGSAMIGSTKYAKVEITSEINWEESGTVRKLSFDKGVVVPEDCSGLFRSYGPVSIDMSNIDTSHVTNMSRMFNCYTLEELNLSGFDTSSATDMSGMFFDSQLTELDLSGFDTSKVTNMEGMFSYCRNLTALDVSGFNTFNVTDMSGMFRNCETLTSLDVSAFDTASVTEMDYMFFGCGSLTALDVSGFNTEKVTTIAYMFNSCKNVLELDLSGWKLTSLTNARRVLNGTIPVIKAPVNLAANVELLANYTGSDGLLYTSLPQYASTSILLTWASASGDPGGNASGNPSASGNPGESGDPSGTCEHVYGAWVITNPATCTEDGSRERVCTICGNKENDTISAVGHQWDEAFTTDKEATCTEDGSESHHCVVCGISDSTTAVVIPAKGHKMTRTAGKEATCTEAGNTEYWSCSRCEKLFSDASGTEETTLEATVIPAKGHAMTRTAGKEATCTEGGNTEYWTCSSCNKLFSDASGTEETTLEATVIPAKGHAMTKTAGNDATCTEAGNTEYWTCSRCNKLFSDASGTEETTLEATVIPAKGHALTKTDREEATCTEAGNTEYWTCSRCDKLFSDASGTEETTLEATVIPAKGHVWAEEYAVDKNATCAEEGSKSIHCTVCDEIKEDSSQVIPKTQDHKYDEWVVTKEATCAEEGSESLRCTVCGEIKEGSSRSIPKTDGHKYGDWIVTKPATSTETGIHEKVCEICGNIVEEEIPILKGEWIKNSKGWWYSWSDGTYPKSKFENINGKTYYFDSNGYMVTGWQKIDGKWYYFSGSGAMQKDWQKIDDKWYYFNGSGVMQTGWQKISGKQYYFSGSGAMVTGWQKIDGKWYYFSGSGAMQKDWQKIGSTWYYFGESGVMATGWQKIGSRWYYFEGSGAMAANKWVGNYYLTGSGAMATNTWIGKYYVGADGKWIPGYKAAN